MRCIWVSFVTVGTTSSKSLSSFEGVSDNSWAIKVIRLAQEPSLVYSLDHVNDALVKGLNEGGSIKQQHTTRLVINHYDMYVIIYVVHYLCIFKLNDLVCDVVTHDQEKSILQPLKLIPQVH